MKNESSKVDHESIITACKYFYMPTRLKYAKEEDTDQILFNFATGKGDIETAKKHLLKSVGINTFLSLIAKKNNKKLHDKEVIEAYFLGNKLLEKVNGEDIKKTIIEDMTKKGLDLEEAENLAKYIPSNATPNHALQLMHLHVYTEGQLQAYSDYERCRISAGVIKKIENEILTIEHQPIIYDKNKKKFMVDKKQEKTIDYHNKMISKLKIGDIVSVHWNHAIDKITEEQVKNLEEYTQKNIEAINEHMGKMK